MVVAVFVRCCWYSSKSVAVAIACLGECNVASFVFCMGRVVLLWLLVVSDACC